MSGAITYTCCSPGCGKNTGGTGPLCPEHAVQVAAPPAPATPATRRHARYFRAIPRREIDVYRVLKAFSVDDPALQHAVKKILLAGDRGTKNFRQDVLEAGDSISRCLEMLTEEEFPDER